MMSQKDLEELAKRPWPQMFTVMIWMRDIFKDCPCQVLLEECGISANPRISTSGELYDVIKSTLQNYYPHWPPLGPICESTGSYLSRPGNQAFTMCTQLVASSFFIGGKYWASNPSACSEDICQVFLTKQRICWMLPQFLWVQLVPGRRPSCATLP